MISRTLNFVAKRMRPINTVWSEISTQSQEVTTYMPKGKRLKNINCVSPLRPFFPERSVT